MLAPRFLCDLMKLT